MPDKPTILIVDDEKNILTSLSRMLDLEGFRPVVAGSGRVALDKLADETADAVLLDVRMPDMDGVQTLAAIRETYPDIPVVMMSGHASLEVAVSALQAGAVDFIEKPVGMDRLLVTLRNTLRMTDLTLSHRDLTQRLASHDDLIGQSRPMVQLHESIDLAAPSRARVLITGENGTGKELIARAIHEGSDRSNGPFIKVNCAAIPSELIESELFGHEKGAFTGATQARKGKFELAHGGTLFLDEIGDMRLEMQAKLLRVLQEEEFERVGGARTIRVDVRILSATNKELPTEIEAGTFREDLYYRLNVIPIEAVPLRDRRDDIRLLADHFVAQACTQNNRRAKVVTDAALEVLMQHRWPGNVRELKNTCERLVILGVGEAIDASQVHRLLPEYRARSGGGYESGKTLREMVNEAERIFIQGALDEHDGHVTKLVDVLLVSVLAQSYLW